MPTSGGASYTGAPPQSAGRTPAPIAKPPARASERFLGQGTVVRFAPVKGVTPKNALDRRIWLPAVLGDLAVAEDALFNDYDTLSGGQYSVASQGPASARRQRTGSLDTLTIDFDVPWLVAVNQDPDWLRARLYEIMRSRKMVHMLITFRPNPYSTPEFSGHVTIRNLSRTTRQGERDTRYMTLQWNEARDPTTKRRSHTGSTGKSKTTSRKKGSDLPTTAALTSTDTLDSLSYEYYGTYKYWRQIRDANGIPSRFGAKTPIVSLPGRFKVGAKVKIPKVTAPSGGAAA